MGFLWPLRLGALGPGPPGPLSKTVLVIGMFEVTCRVMMYVNVMLSMMDDDEITSCCKCRQLLTDPTTLSCLDSLCGKCFREISDNSAGVASCPRCGVQIGDLQAMPDRGFIDMLVALKKIANQNTEDDKCDICKHLSASSEPVAAAEHYCIECRQKMCAVCARPHRAFSATTSHSVVGLGQDSAKEVLREFRCYTLCCAIHKDVHATVHCYQCSIGLCSQCQEKHSGHYVEVLTDDTYSNLTNKVKCLWNQLREQFCARKEKTDGIQKLLRDRPSGVEDAEREINSKADEIISLIDKERHDLLRTLHSRNNESVSMLEAVSQSLLFDLSANLKALKFAEELLEKGSVQDMLLNWRMLVTRLHNLSYGSSVLDDCMCSDTTLASPIRDACTSQEQPSMY